MPVLEAALARKLHLAPLAAPGVRPYCPSLMSALKSAINVALTAALKRKPWKTMQSRHMEKQPPKHSSANTMGSLKGKPLGHRWSRSTVAMTNGLRGGDFLKAKTTPCSAGTATCRHPLENLTTNPQIGHAQNPPFRQQGLCMHNTCNELPKSQTRRPQSQN